MGVIEGNYQQTQQNSVLSVDTDEQCETDLETFVILNFPVKIYVKFHPLYSVIFFLN